MPEYATIAGNTGIHDLDKESGSIESGIKKHVLAYKVTTIAEAETYGDGTYRGMPLIRRSWDLLPGELGYELTLEYSGPENEDEEGVVELDVSFGEKPIEQHWNIEKIKSIYQGSINPGTKEIEFKKTIKRGNASGLAAGSGEIKNPMFGVKTYLVLAAVVRQTLIEEAVPSLSRIGNVVTSVPRYRTPKGYDWMEMPPRSRSVGGGRYENTYEYLMSEKGGWPIHVYGQFLIQI